jgi:hypothetical protein
MNTAYKYFFETWLSILLDISKGELLEHIEILCVCVCVFEKAMGRTPD